MRAGLQAVSNKGETMSYRNLVAVLIFMMMTGCGEPAKVEQPAAFEVEIRWTSYGIPHVKADDWIGVGLDMDLPMPPRRTRFV